MSIIRKSHRVLLESLESYASGNGALSLVWIKYQNGERKSSGRKVTKRQAEVLLETEQKKGSLLNHKLVELNGQFLFVHVFKRIDETHLQDGDGQVFQVIVNRMQAKQRGWLHIDDLSVLTNVADVGVVVVRHVSTLHAMLFFIEHEKELAGKL